NLPGRDTLSSRSHRLFMSGRVLITLSRTPPNCSPREGVADVHSPAAALPTVLGRGGRPDRSPRRGDRGGVHGPGVGEGGPPRRGAGPAAAGDSAGRAGQAAGRRGGGRREALAGRGGRPLPPAQPAEERGGRGRPGRLPLPGGRRDPARAGPGVG